MVSFNYVIKDELGIHARPAGMLVKEVAKLSSTVTIKKGEKSGNAKMIFGIMGLAVKCGDEVTVTIEGENETADAEVIKAFFENNL
ncbi:HPr family phosphocarrier protein [Lachnoclostridium sp. An181]|uniref:HPr family phosphocarrier protein n=1 Tax=Lachnoclostridium sp. An181 TaxID=1965575 RepID=UPI000B39A053|nr:HPr family phosphocarrier protein [Lachnoclostridium sp. An181]OUP49122.1 PTS galactitol transporter subunit IIC [Lachnoclostridium sp. An181]